MHSLSKKEKILKYTKIVLSTIKAISLPIGDTITDLFLIYEYYNEDRPDRAKTLLTIFFISHIICCAVIFQRLRKQEAKAVWCSRPRQILFTFATVFTLGPVVLKLVEIYGEEDRVHGARKPTCYSKLTLCFLECIPQVVLNTFYICSDGCFCANQIISLSLSIAAACYAVQRYTNPASEKLSRPIENTIHTAWIFCILMGNILPFALMAGLFSPFYLITGFLSVYALTFLMLCRAVLIGLLVSEHKREKWFSFQGFLFNAFLSSDEEQINRKFNFVFFATALLSFVILSTYVCVYFYYVIIEPEYFKFGSSIQSCHELIGVPLFMEPLVMLIVTASCLIMSNIFVFFVILTDWETMQKIVYKIRGFFCGRCISTKGFEFDKDTENVAVPGADTEIGMVLKREISKIEGKPTLERAIKRETSYWGESVVFESRMTPQAVNHYNKSSSSKESAAKVEENPTPKSQSSKNYSDPNSTTELISFKARATSLMHYHDEPLQSIGEASEV